MAYTYNNRALLVALIKKDKTNQIEIFCSKAIADYEALDIDDIDEYIDGFYECSKTILELIKENRSVL